jgi:molecular chaperone DnaK
LLIDARNEAESVIHATEKSLRRPDFEQIAAEALEPGEREHIELTLGELKRVMTSSDREMIQERTHVLNDVTRHLAEVVMNRTLRAALAGRNVEDL